MEFWAVHVETCQNRVTRGYKQLAAIGGGTRLIHKLPLFLNYPRIFSLLSLFKYFAHY
jgi:hypothetical protein